MMDVDLVYKDEVLPDLICFGKIIVELKVMERLTSKDESQLLNYLNTTRMRVGLLINYGANGPLDWKRFVL
jgi:GxxExxY protein